MIFLFLDLIVNALYGIGNSFLYKEDDID